MYRLNQKFSYPFNAKRWFKRTFSKRHNQRRALFIIACLLIVSQSLGLLAFRHQSDVKSYRYYVLQHETRKSIKRLNIQLKEVEAEKTASQAEVQAKAAHEAELQKQIDDLNKQLQAKTQAKQSLASSVINTLSGTRTAYAAPAPSIVSGCGDNSYANFIYMHESGCNTAATNPGGCFGIGQACPGSKLAYCGTDYACQNAFFTAYANKYGGWAGAYAFWLGHSWW